MSAGILPNLKQTKKRNGMKTSYSVVVGLTTQILSFVLLVIHVVNVILN